jgi:hypothetical protein
VGFLSRLLSRSESAQPTTFREMTAEAMRAEAAANNEDIVEVWEIVGESFYQEALSKIAGPKHLVSKSEHVGVTLRCDPTNEHDENAIRVEVMGFQVGSVCRQTAATLSPAIQRSFGGILEGRGVIVGGWLDDGRDDLGRFAGTRSEGSYGIRVWITKRDTERLQIRADVLDPSLQAPWPKPPPVQPNERRLSPTYGEHDVESHGSAVTVTCEEHYQAAIVASMPPDWNPDRSWPLLVDLVLASVNPHASQARTCIEVRFRDQTVGFFTPKMTDRHAEVVSGCADEGMRATATAKVSHGTKAGQTIYRVKLLMP